MAKTIEEVLSTLVRTDEALWEGIHPEGFLFEGNQ
jgi:hypothetical protein